MNIRTSVALVLLIALAIPVCADEKKKGQVDRGMLESMEAVPCGANQKGITGLGTLWASAGITHVNSTEKLCPQYLLRTDEMEYEIRPTNLKHATILQIGQEGEFKIKKNQLFLTFQEGSDRKTRAYQVVGINPTKADTDRKSSNLTSDAH